MISEIIDVPLPLAACSDLISFFTFHISTCLSWPSPPSPPSLDILYYKSKKKAWQRRFLAKAWFTAHFY